MTPSLPVLDLSTLTSTDGFVVQGDRAQDHAGISVSGVGDINGDGIDDLILGAHGGDDGGVSAGEAYVIYGTADSNRGPIDLTTMSRGDGFVIQGDQSYDHIGFSVSGAGDVNGDGIADMIVGGIGVNSPGLDDPGGAYVIYGTLGSMRTRLDLTGLASGDGFKIEGANSQSSAGSSVSGIGDINDDGIDDILIGATTGYDDPPGSAYVVYGMANSTRETLSLAELALSDGFSILGDSSRDGAGRSVSGAGDVNGDGIDDLIVGAPFGDDGGSNAGEAYVIYGTVDGTRDDIDLGELAASDGFTMQGNSIGDLAGRSVSGAGDIDGDGIDDILVGAAIDFPGGNDANSAYVIYGKADSDRSRIDLAGLDADTGFLIQDSRDHQAGFSVSNAGDINGDGLDDLILGAPYGQIGGNNAGEAYIIYGAAGRSRSLIDLSELQESDGFVIVGEMGGGEGVNNKGDLAGYSVSGAGDLNSDGIDDLIVGAPYADIGGTDSGAAYVIYGTDGNRSFAIAAGVLGEGSLVGTPVVSLPVSDGFVPDFALVSGNADLDGDSILAFTIDATTGAITVNDADDLDFETTPVFKLGVSGFDAEGGAVERLVNVSLIDLTEQIGTDASDVMIGTAGRDALSGFGCDDALYGKLGDDRLLGGAGNDLLDGGRGADTLVGGAGNDRYVVDGDDLVVERAGEGTDTIYFFRSVDLTGLEVENAAVLARLSTLSTTMIGNDMDNVLLGSAGENLLDGRGGGDRMVGGFGDDTYVVDNQTDRVIELADQGNDVLRASFSVSLTKQFVFVEDLMLEGAGRIGTGNAADNRLTGSDDANILRGLAGADVLFGLGGDDSLFGGDGDDRIIGGTGNDALIGGAGMDVLIGSEGDDSYRVDNKRDNVVEGHDSGFDVVSTGVSFALSAHVEDLSARGEGGALNLIGNGIDNRLTGNGYANTLAGRGGNDTLTGGLGADTFVFDRAPDGTGNLDTVTDFQTGIDGLTLIGSVFGGLSSGRLESAAFHVGNAAADSEDRIIYDQSTGALWFDADGSGAGEQVQVAALSNLAALMVDDILVV